MGILKISDQLHDEVRSASRALSRSINAQAEHWIRLGRLCELNPTLTGVELMHQLLAAAQQGEPEDGQYQDA
ncbi:ParD-like family protein [Gallaecimonas sp. GXIMD4217]|uniref:ParD-like family protein n=1 Tax=Gallaecimonas sp. GXIMD4217 TaxID=3131927 RepID=UPI00311AC7BE